MRLGGSVLRPEGWDRTARFAACVVLSFAALAGGGTEADTPSGVQGSTQPRPTAGRADPIAQGRISECYGRLPLIFEPNQGQMEGRVKFLARGSGYALFLTSTEAVLAVTKTSTVSGQPSAKRQGMALAMPVNGLTHSPFGAFAPEVPGSAGRLSRSAAYPGSLQPAQLQNNSAPQSEHRNPNSELPGEAVLRMGLVGGNPEVKVTGLGELPGKSNYFLGKDPKKWRKNIRNYAQVRYKEVYPGIDLVYYGNQRELEFDFVVAPGTDPRAIRLAFENGVGGDGRGNASPLQIEASGDLVIKTEGGEVRFHKPVVYQPVAGTAVADHRYHAAANPQSKIQNRKSVDGCYMLQADNRIGFELGDYDRRRPLVIDPEMSYSSYLGGSGYDYAHAIAVDSSGNAYVTGYTNSATFPVASPLQAASGGGGCGTGADVYPCFDAFVTKLNAAGSAVVYSTYLGGSGEDYGISIAVGATSDRAYVTGHTNSVDFPTASSLQGTHGGGTCAAVPDTFPCFDAFVAVLDAAGSELVYSTYLGGSAEDYGTGVAVDFSGNAHVVGYTTSADFPLTTDALQPRRSGSYDAFVAEVNSTGSALAYSTYLGGSGEDYGRGIAVDSSGATYVTGATNSLDFPAASAVQPAQAGGTCGALSSTFPCFDAFVAKLSVASGALVYSTYLGGTGGDYGSAIAVDSSESAYVVGYTSSTDFPVTPEAFQATGGGASYDAFVTKLNAAGTGLVYSTYLGGIGAEAGYSIAVDSSANAYMAGYTYGAGFPTVSPLQAASGGFYDAFAAKFNAAGSALLFATYFGGTGNEEGRGIAVDPSGNVYVTGGTFSPNLPTTTAAFQSSFGGGAFDAFVAKIKNLAFPFLSLSETSLTFSAQGVHTTSEAKAVTVTNSGDAPLTISNIAESGDFAQASTCGSPGPLAPGANCTLNISFSPTELGSRTGTVTITHNAYGSPHVIELSGNGVAAPAVSLSATTLTFGEQLLGTASATHTTTLTNTGQALLNVASIAARGDFSQTNTCGAPLPVEGTCTISVAFAPLVPGTNVGAITITDNAPGSPHVISLAGTGLGPALALSSENLAFPDQLVSTTSAPETLQLTNSGNLPLEIRGITSSGDFQATSNCGPSLPPAVSCTLSVTFSPPEKGARTGSVTITHNGLRSPTTVSLSGTGRAPGARLSATEIMFGPLPVGTTSDPQTVTLTNSGTAPLLISGVSVSGDFTQTNNCQGTVTVGASCEISLTFAPQEAGTRAGTLAITNSLPLDTYTANLSGTGTDFSLSASPSTATINAGQAAAYTVDLIPLGGFRGEVSLGCAGAPKATKCSVAPTSVVLDGSESQSITVTVTTTAQGKTPPLSTPPVEFLPGVTPQLPLPLIAWFLPLLVLAGLWLAPRRAWMSLAATFLLAASLTACGGGGSAPAVITRPTEWTPAGTYTLTLTASSGGLSHSTKLTLKVN